MGQEYKKSLEEGRRKMETTFLNQTMVMRESAIFMQQLIEDYDMEDLLESIDYPFDKSFEDIVSEVTSFHRRIKNEVERRKYQGD